MPEQQESYYVKRLMEEHARLIMNDDPATEDAHLAQIDFYKGKLSRMGVNYDPVAREWVRSAVG